MCETLEENVLLEDDKHMQPATLKGVSEQYSRLTGIDTTIISGEFVLDNGRRQMAVLGAGLAYYLSVNVNFISSIRI
jgi:lipoprotein-releasing system permease protein